MKSFVTLGALVASAWGQMAQFTNTSFTGPFNLGQTVPIMWTSGNGLPLSLAIFNSTWNYKIFDGRAVLPTTYDWVVSTLPDMVSGEYQFALQQVNAGVSTSPFFRVNLAANTSASGTATSASVVTATVTYVYWDDMCGCTKTGSIASPLNTGLPATTTKWWDNECGCHMSAVVPVATLPATNNYTMPAASPPPPMATSVPMPAPTPATTTTGNAAPATFTGEAIRAEGSILGMIVLVAAVALM